jgi:FkbM family methyltransferase
MEIRALSRGEARLLYEEIFVKHAYLRHGVELDEGDVVVDVGANIGLFSLFVGWTLSDFTLYVFEPIPDVFEALRLNTSRLAGRVVLFNVGLSDREGEAVFAYYPRLASFTTSYPDRLEKRWGDLRDILMRSGGEGVGREGGRGPRARLRSWLVDGVIHFASRKKDRICRLTRLSTIIADCGIERIDLLKVDVEGGEWDVLRGVDEADWEKIRQVVVEVHDSEASADVMSDWLGLRGFDVAMDQEDRGRRSPLALLYARRRSGSRDEKASGRRLQAQASRPSGPRCGDEL